MHKSVLTKKLLQNLFEKKIDDLRCIIVIERSLNAHFINMVCFEESGSVVSYTPGMKFTRHFDNKVHHTGTDVTFLIYL